MEVLMHLICASNIHKHDLHTGLWMSLVPLPSAVKCCVCVCANQTRTAYLISGYDTLHINDHNLTSQPAVHSVGWFQNRGNMSLSRCSESTLGGHVSAALLCTRSVRSDRRHLACCDGGLVAAVGLLL